MNIEFVPALYIGALYLILFTLVEIFYRIRKPHPEITRKLIHFISGIIACFFPFIFSNTLTVIILGIVFTGVLYAAKKLHLLQSATDVTRKTLGEVYFPMSIMFLFIIAGDKPAVFVISMLMLTISDPVGAIIGQTYGSIKYRVQDNQKSLEGSFMFFLISFIVLHIGILLFMDVTRINSLLIAVLAAALITAIESISLEGMDNLFIPLGTCLILLKLPNYPSEVVLMNVSAITLVIIVSIVLSVKVKNLSISGLIAIILFGYASWMLASVIYYVVIVAFFIGFLFMNIIFSIKPQDQNESFLVKPVLYLILVPFLIVFTANVLSIAHFLFPSFLISAGLHFVMLWRHWFIDGKVSNQWFSRKKAVMQHTGILFCGLFVFLTPFLYYNTQRPATLTALFFIAVIAGDMLYLVIRKYSCSNISYYRNRRLRMMINVLIVSIVILIQNIYLGIV